MYCSIKDVILDIIPEVPGIVVGKVINENPLGIELVNDVKMRLGPHVLLIADYLKDYDVTIEINDTQVTGATTNENNHSHNVSGFTMKSGIMTIRNGLKKDELVYLLPQHSYKKYFVLSRVN